jgi:hypothetical protein
MSFGSVTPPQGDIVDVNVHLGCSKEVSSFSVKLQNWDKKYSPSGTTPITVGLDGSINIGRGSNLPPIIACHVESVEYEHPNPDENYVTVSGRCFGEKLFRRVITKDYSSSKGEAVVKDLMDNYANLSHNRGGTELVEDTDTTFNKLEYENTPLWDVLKYVAESSDKAGVIGYDFRVAPDGKFEFFAKNSKSASINLVDKGEFGSYKKDILRVRNKIIAYGMAAKVNPSDMDAWTETITSWTHDAGGSTLTADSSDKVAGTASIKLRTGRAGTTSGWAKYALASPIECGGDYGYQSICAVLRATGEDLDSGCEYRCTKIRIQLMTDDSNYFQKEFILTESEAADIRWIYHDEKIGKPYETASGTTPAWTKTGSPNWKNINKVLFYIEGYVTKSGLGRSTLHIDQLYFKNGRFSALEQDSASQALYGIRELTETDDELASDAECAHRAKALLAYLKDPAEYLTMRSTIIDYGLTPPLAADKIHVHLYNENINGDYRTEAIDYHVYANSQTLELTFDLGKVPPLLADYLYGLRATTVTVEKLARVKLGKGAALSQIIAVLAAQSPPHKTTHEAGDESGVIWSDPSLGGSDRLSGWIQPKYIGPYTDVADRLYLRTKNIAGSVNLHHIFCPTAAAYGKLGDSSLYWYELWVKYVNMIDSLALWYPGDSYSSAYMVKGALWFGAGNIALDVKLYRSAAEVLKTDDNFDALALRIGATEVITAARILQNLQANLKDPLNLYSGADAYPGAILQKGALYFGPGTGGCDVNLYRVDATHLRTDNNFSCFSLALSGTIVITSAGVIQNLSADAGLITSGILGVDRIPTLSRSKISDFFAAAFWANIPDKPSTYPPSSHTHSASAVTSGTFAEERIPHNFMDIMTFPGGITTSSLATGAVNCTNWHATDIIFKNDFRITEAENLKLGKGLAFLNPKGKIIMLLDENGNLALFGKLRPKSFKLNRLWMKMRGKRKEKVSVPS